LSKNLDSRRFTGCLKSISFFSSFFFLSLFGGKIIVVFDLSIDESVARELNFFAMIKARYSKEKHKIPN